MEYPSNFPLPTYPVTSRTNRPIQFRSTAGITSIKIRQARVKQVSFSITSDNAEQVSAAWNWLHQRQGELILFPIIPHHYTRTAAARLIRLDNLQSRSGTAAQFSLMIEVYNE